MKEIIIDYYSLIQASIEYIENNLKEKISLDTLSSQACFSKYHYDRIFRTFVGESPIEYVRKRRLSKAAKELVETNKKIVEIGIEYSFSSPEIFSRAFKKEYGVTPGNYREAQSFIALYDKVDLIKNRINKLCEGRIKEPEIIIKEKFYVMGMECLIDIEENGNNQSIPKLWNIFLSEKVKLGNCKKNDNMMGICMNSCFSGKFSYTVCMEVENIEEVPLGMSLKTIPSSAYAVFTHKGPLDKLSDTYDMIYGVWLPFSNYMLFSGIDDIEVYDSRFTLDEKCEIDIYIPIIL